MPIDDALKGLRTDEPKKMQEPQITLDDYFRLSQRQMRDFEKLKLWKIHESDIEMLVDVKLVPEAVAKKYLSAQNELILGLEARVEPTSFQRADITTAFCASASVSFIAASVFSIYTVLAYDIQDQGMQGGVFIGAGAASLAMFGALMLSYSFYSKRKIKKFLEKTLGTNIDDTYSRYIDALALIKEISDDKQLVSYKNGKYNSQEILDTALKLRKNAAELDNYFNKLREAQ